VSAREIAHGPARWLALLGAGLALAARAGAEPPLPREHAAFGGAPPASLDPPRPAAAPAPARPPRRVFGKNGCSADMVRVADRFCVDRFESSMVDATSARPLSPYYPPTPKLLRFVAERWTDATDGTNGPFDLAFPPVPDWERESGWQPRAVSLRGSVPQGYVSGETARVACANAGKRLCTLDEWTTACRGERGTLYPYGDAYRQGACNVFREDHPARILHGNASVNHLDPRLNLVPLDGEPLLRPAGATPQCRSKWGRDAIYDMVGNLDEWVDDPDGTFVGGFYSRSTRSGCDAKVTTHPATYFDYSLGVRCCDRLR
jgi:hypothetical protein